MPAVKRALKWASADAGLPSIHITAPGASERLKRVWPGFAIWNRAPRKMPTSPEYQGGSAFLQEHADLGSLTRAQIKKYESLS